MSTITMEYIKLEIDNKGAQTNVVKSKPLLVIKLIMTLADTITIPILQYNIKEISTLSK